MLVLGGDATLREPQDDIASYEFSFRYVSRISQMIVGQGTDKRRSYWKKVRVAICVATRC